MKSFFRWIILIVGLVYAVGGNVHAAEPIPVFETPEKQQQLMAFSSVVAQQLLQGFSQEISLDDEEGVKQAAQTSVQAIADTYHAILDQATHDTADNWLHDVYKAGACFVPRDEAQAADEVLPMNRPLSYPNGAVALACELFDACRDGIATAVLLGGQGGVGLRIGAFFSQTGCCQSFIDALKEAAPDIQDNWYKRSFNTLPDAEAEYIAEDVKNTIVQVSTMQYGTLELAQKREKRLRIAISILSAIAPGFITAFFAPTIPLLATSLLCREGAGLILSIIMNRCLKWGLLLPNNTSVLRDLGEGCIGRLTSFAGMYALGWCADGLKWGVDKALALPSWAYHRFWAAAPAAVLH